MNANDLLASARQWQHSGELPRAEAAYRQLLTIDPNNAEIWYLVGTTCQPQGKAAEALTAFQRAVAIKPEFSQAQNSLGIALAQQGRSREAEHCFSAAVRAQPEFAQGHNNLGNALKEQGRREEALACYQEAVRLKPEFAEALNNLGNLQRELGRFDDAVANCRQALRLKPDLADAHNNLGAAYSSLRRWDDAVASYRQAIVLRPNHAEAHSNLGNALRELGRLDEAVISLRQALQLRPDFAEAHGGLAMVLAQRDEMEDALASCDAALRLRPELATAQLSKGFILSELGRRPEALECCQKALELQPDMPDAHKNRSLIWLLEGKLAEGFTEYEWRWKCPELPERPFKEPLWDGSPLADKTILLHAEQGLGDTLQFARYASLVHERGGRVVLVCQRALIPLMKRCQGVAQVVAQGDHLPSFDTHAPLLGLPRIFGTTLESIPANIPYIEAESSMIEQWRGELSGMKGFKVGIAWQGSKTYRRDRSRSVPLAEFAPLANIPGVRLVSLQKGHGSEQIAGLGCRFEVLDLSSRLDEGTGAFMDTAAVMKNLDLVITSDTAIPHLAGALGVPVWVALPSVPDWRWLLGREDSPWYPTMRLFRQPRRGDWEHVFRRIAAALAKQLGVKLPARPVNIEVAPGELIDKITILQIKDQRIHDPAKLTNVRTELATLVAARDNAIDPSRELDELTAALKQVNEALWQIEDEIRVCERQNDFGPRFIELARAVYHENDRRAALKRQINDLLGSRLIEEKSYVSY
jgi:tetratricopeptide (TPR) repeat protein